MGARTFTIAACLLALLISTASRSELVAPTKPIRPMTVGLMQTVRSFVADNDAAARYAKLSDDGSAFFEIHLDDPNLGGLQLRYRSGACAYDFPPGRWLEVDQTAGRITLLTSFMPLPTLSFD